MSFCVVHNKALQPHLIPQSIRGVSLGLFLAGAFSVGNKRPMLTSIDRDMWLVHIGEPFNLVQLPAQQ